MKQLVVTSGKGGTGKTSVVASLAALADDIVLADCDVDAADLHLVLSPERRRREVFSAGFLAVVDASACAGCGRCVEACRFGAITLEDGQASVNAYACEGCGVGELVCPAGAVRFEETDVGEWFVSDTPAGPMVHARLRPGAENSGKLVTVVRREARAEAARCGAGLILIDGSPGIGCPVIASLTGADLALAVTEPTLSAQHDLERVVEVSRILRTPVVVAINRWDINLDVTNAIEEWCHKEELPVVGLIPYDTAVTRAQIEGRSVVETSDGAAAASLDALWRRVEGILTGTSGED
ncbi:MAG: (4Fe-4S)-binding protein [Candidatus Eisenbacteria bacterium]|nr:(4Fe-4S)-binding protein [Candidatus Eisenbacteria bacterium]